MSIEPITSDGPNAPSLDRATPPLTVIVLLVTSRREPLAMLTAPDWAFRSSKYPAARVALLLMWSVPPFSSSSEPSGRVTLAITSTVPPGLRLRRSTVIACSSNHRALESATSIERNEPRLVLRGVPTPTQVFRLAFLTTRLPLESRLPFKYTVPAAPPVATPGFSLPPSARILPDVNVFDPA